MNDVHKKELFDKHSEGLSTEVKNILWMLIDDEEDVCCTNLYRNDKDIILDIYLRNSVYAILILKNCHALIEEDLKSIRFWGYNTLIKKDNGMYKLLGVAEYYNNEYESPVFFEFKDALVDIKVYRLESYVSYGYIYPWDMLIYNANCILNKYSIGDNLLNEKEIKLVPLLAEINRMSTYFNRRAYGEYHENVYPCLREIITECGFNELLKYIDRLELVSIEKNKYDRIIALFKSKLNCKEYEPLWRIIYNKIQESQCEYETSTCVREDSSKIKRICNVIHEHMLENGYEGEYPSYRKKDSISKIHLVASYDIPYFIFNEKNVVHHICFSDTESEYYDDYLFQILCGSQMLKDGEKEGDIYSCMFDAKGRCLFNSELFTLDEFLENDIVDEAKIKEYLDVAIKKTELKKLSKNQKDKASRWDSFSLIKLWLYIFVFLGGLFGILMILGIMLISLLLGTIFKSWNEAVQVVMEIPWLKFLIVTWIGYGGIMGILYVIAYKK